MTLAPFGLDTLWLRTMQTPWGLALAPHMTDLRTHVVRRHARRFEHRRKMGAVGSGFGDQHVRLERAKRPFDIVENPLVIRPLRKKNRQHDFKRHQPPLNLRPVIVDRMRGHISCSLVSISEDYRRHMSRRQLVSLRAPDITRMYETQLARRQA